MRFGLFLLLFSALSIKADDLLVKVKLSSDDVRHHIDRKSFQVVAELEEFYLIRADSADFARLNRLGVSLQVLEIPEGKMLFYVYFPHGFDSRPLHRFGTVLSEDKNGVLLATDGSSLLELNRLPVELVHISLTPRQIYPELSPPPAPAVSESLVIELVSRVNADSVLAHIRRLQDFYTRFSTTESCRAAVEWMRDKLLSYGCDSIVLEDYLPGYVPNLIGVKGGRVNPNLIYVICGHIDNTSDFAPDRCPGSDDNASGTAAVIEAARAFQEIDFDYSVYFIGFTGEEQGLWGSDSFANRARRRGDSIIAVLNFDMISYGRQNRDTLNVIGRNSSPNCAWLVDSFIANARAYTGLKTRRRLVNPGQAGYSDHASFWKYGYVALCGIENDFTPEYHTIGDTIGPLYYVNCGTNNWLMATEAIKAAVATIAKLAGAGIRTGVAQEEPKHIGPAVRTVGKPPFRLPFNQIGASDIFTIYDAQGRKVRSLSGNIWNGKDTKGRGARPGIYLVIPNKGTPTYRTAVKLVVTY